MLVFGGAQEQAVEDSLLSLGAAAVTVRRFNDAHILDTSMLTLRCMLRLTGGLMYLPISYDLRTLLQKLGLGQKCLHTAVHLHPEPFTALASCRSSAGCCTSMVARRIEALLISACSTWVRVTVL